MAESWSVAVDRHEHVAVVRLSGEIDVLAEPDVREAVKNALTEPPPPVLELDLSGVTFMDSYGLYAAVIRPAEAAEHAAVETRVVVNPAVRAILERAGVSEHLTIVDQPTT
jgi:anti-anti-sigma factor